MTPIDIQELKQTFAWIAERVRRGHEGLQPIHGSTALKAIDYFDQCEAQKAACTCGAYQDTYRIPVERDTPAYTALRIAGINRIIEADEEANAFLFGGK